MAARRKRWTWGGARPGAGRPPLADETADLTIRFPKADLDALRSLSAEAGVSTGELAREAVRRYVARRRKR